MLFEVLVGEPRSVVGIEDKVGATRYLIKVECIGVSGVEKSKLIKLMFFCKPIYDNNFLSSFYLQSISILFTLWVHF